MLNDSDWLARPRIVAGAMSGTSFDGVDAALVRFTQADSHTRIELLGFASVEFPSSFRHTLMALTERPLAIGELGDCSCVLMHYYERAITGAITAAHASPVAIGIHGQTLWHAPTPSSRDGVLCRSTFQLATPAILAATFGVPVVSDVRSADVALGGQGAPLVPLLDWELLHTEHDYVIGLNIGGIANVTLLPPDATLNSIRAFDTGPGNVWIDSAMHRYWGKRFDEGGKTAAAGQIIPSLLEQLKAIPYIVMPPPKTTGRELFSVRELEQYLVPLERAMVCPEDIVATLTAFTAWSIAENIRRFAREDATIVVSGGGSYNTTVLDALKQELPRARILRLSDYCGIPESIKEAVLMAYIAYRTLGGLPSSIPSVTGASRAAVLGSITPPP
ncbi:MAG: anhydro-N-acetylmuramic acid kinase [Candidatus Kapaibacterium sp.]|nr:MAG: anhydro-N-acetylmuramic acid kinase [Candidatus Kapabacteria bacterium]